MRLLCAALAIVLMTATAGVAQELPSVPSQVLPAADSAPTPRKVADKKFWLLGSGLNSAMLLDTKSTFDVSHACSACYEANPFVAPFVRRGPVPTYVAGELFDAGVMALSARMRGSDRRWMRRTWWVIPTALIAGHSIAYHHNLNLLK